jgi:1,2-diacylglycerol-3-alpha-glucose alpha-1,2-glucosyltransferase
MKVLLYTGFLKVISKSGVGEAIRHQASALERMDIPYTNNVHDDFDVVHINTIFPDSLLLSKRARRKGKKVIYYAHTTMEDFRNSFRGSNFFAPLFKRWITYCYNNSDLIITPTEYSKSLLDQYGIHPPIHVLSNGIDMDFFAKDQTARMRFRQKYNIPESQKVVVSVGHFIERKGILDFVELARQLPEHQFYWFGCTNLQLVPKHIRYAVETDLPNLHFPGYVNRNELKDAYCGGDLFVFMTHEETEGIVLLEALATRIPILVRDIPIYSTWLESGRSVYKAKKLKDFTKMTDDILNGRLPNLTENGYRLAKERDLSVIGKKLRILYRQPVLLANCQ